MKMIFSHSVLACSQIDLSSNMLCGVYVDDFGDMCGTYTAEGIKALADAIAVSASLTQVHVFRPHALPYRMLGACSLNQLAESFFCARADSNEPGRRHWNGLGTSFRS